MSQGISEERLTRIIAFPPASDQGCEPLEGQEMAVELKQLRQSHAQLVKALEWFFEQLDARVLVRDVSLDHRTDWLIRVTTLTQGLLVARAALATAKKVQGATYGSFRGNEKG